MAKVRSSARKSGTASVRSALTTPTSVTSGKWCPLGDHLRTDQHLAAWGGEALEHAREARERRGHVRIEPQQLDARQETGHLALERLGAVPEAGQLGAS